MKISQKFIKFLFIGGYNTIICLIIFKLLIQFNFNYLLASGLMNIFGIVHGYVLNAKLLYHSTLSFHRLFKYFNVYAIAFVLNLIAMYILVSLLHVAPFISQVLTTAVLTILNYQLVKIFVFAIKKENIQ